MPDNLGRLDAPAFHRNHQPIWSVLGPHLADKRGTVLELGSGTGQHVVEFARRTPAITWQPSDVADDHLRSIAAWRQSSGPPNVQAPITIDLLAPDWVSRVEGVEAGTLVAVLCINVVHISPWRVSEHLMAGVPRLLGPDGRLFLYGPYKRDGAHTASSNAAFDASLRAQNPEWGVRDMNDLRTLAERAGLRLAEVTPMPAHNFVLAFTRGA